MCRNLIILSIILSKSIVFAGAFEESVCGAIYSSSTQWCDVAPIHDYLSLLQKRTREDEGTPRVFVDESPKKRPKKTDGELEEHLRKIVGDRKHLSCMPIVIDEEKLNEFGNKFPFLLTACQAQAIEDIAKDFRSFQPMSRVLIGSLGFGKTEVALRTAFMVAASGKQVVVVAPTKELAKQHFETFNKRLGVTNLEVRLLPSGYKKRELLESIENGFAKVIIGTAAVLSKNITYKNVAYIIYDEEHRFGVEQKERLHKLFINAHILWMTATPIPRTLKLIHEGLMMASYLKTAPEGRLAPISKQIVFCENELRPVIDFEMARGGQVFVVAPKISDIPIIVAEINKIYPEEYIICAHGKMYPAEIEDALRKFRSAEKKILIATTIIENGIDIPNANTMIMFHPISFGTSTLCQLRGRIGRAHKQAYCYIAIDPYRSGINCDTQRRFNEFLANSHLGSDIELAQGDLMRRGGGSVFCAQQTGNKHRNTQTGSELQLHPPVIEIADDSDSELTVPLNL